MPGDHGIRQASLHKDVLLVLFVERGPASRQLHLPKRRAQFRDMSEVPDVLGFKTVAPSWHAAAWRQGTK